MNTTSYPIRELAISSDQRRPSANRYIRKGLQVQKMRNPRNLSLQAVVRMFSVFVVLVLSSLSLLSCSRSSQTTLAPANFSTREKELSGLILQEENVDTYFFEMENIKESTQFEAQVLQAVDGKWAVYSAADFSLDSAGLFMIQVRDDGANRSLRLAKGAETVINFPLSTTRSDLELVTALQETIELNGEEQCILAYGSSDGSLVSYELNEILQNDPQADNAHALVLKLKK